MKKTLCILLCVLCALLPASVPAEPAAAPNLSAAYYAAEDDPVAAYIRRDRIQSYMTVWVQALLSKSSDIHWDLNTLAPVRLLDASLQDIDSAPVYTCLFTTGEGDSGYLLFSYYVLGPYIKQHGLAITTPYMYDLNANLDAITAALAQTDLDPATTKATRAEWTDAQHEKNQQIILLEDHQGQVCYYPLNHPTSELLPIKK